MLSDLNHISTIGPQTIIKLNRLHIFKPEDLLYHFPNRYIDFSVISPISQITENQNVTVTGKVKTFQNIYTRSHHNLQKATITDSSGQVDLIWFNQPYLSQTIKPGIVLSFAGTVSLYHNKKTIIAPIFGSSNTGKIIAVYPETSGLKSGWFRKIIPLNLNRLLENISDPLPQTILTQYKLPSLSQSLSQIHEPSNQTLLKQAQLRLGLDEILTLQANSYISKKNWTKKTPQKKFNITPAIAQKITRLIKSLPFTLTPSQQIAWEEIKNDLTSNRPVNRLLLGDVGSGKTIIAILACYLAHLNHSPSLVIAPTKILAAQHRVTFDKFLPQGSTTIATHSAIYQKNKFKNNVGLVIIDEQHKFGVVQRTFLSDSLRPPHTITMTATPIPRTISLTILGNLDISTIKSPPLNRLPIKTFLVPQYKYSDCYRWLKDNIKKNHQQAFIVCPFIEASETLVTVKSAKILFEHLKTEIFPDLKLGLLHSQIKEPEREKILNDFLKNKIQILVTTPIIEVGIDYPNATTIIIQSADRFGLAQLHQLRGRVGRSNLQSYCYLFTESDNLKALGRLAMLQKTNDGQKIAEYDLKTRGPGEAFSIVQHGFPSLKMANITDYFLINLGQKIIKDLASANFDIAKLIKNTDSNLQGSTN